MTVIGRFLGVVFAGLVLALPGSVVASETTCRLYDGITSFVANPDGRAFTIKLDVRDINHRMHGPSELLVKVYSPVGKPVVREYRIARSRYSHWTSSAVSSRPLASLTRRLQVMS